MNMEVFVGAFIPVSVKGQHRYSAKNTVIAYRVPESLILQLIEAPVMKSRERTCSNHHAEIPLPEPTEAAVS